MKPFVVPATVIAAELQGLHHVRLTIDPRTGPSELHRVTVVVNKAERPDWAAIQAGQRVRVGLVVDDARGDSA